MRQNDIKKIIAYQKICIGPLVWKCSTNDFELLLGGGGPTPFLYMATRFLPNVHMYKNVQKCTKYVFSCLEVPWIDLLAVANLQ